MIVKINGVPLQRQPQELKVVVRPNPKLRRLAITLWSVAGSLATSRVFADSGSMSAVLKLWGSFDPMFGTIQGLALVIGTLGLLAGIVIVIFQRRIGRMTLMTAGGMILGTALVPSLVLLLYFLGAMLNDAVQAGIRSAFLGK
ncbi:hypothetical protein RI662_10855 [Brevibacillus agri]|uniref:hypothetical protein n=1 Tax=Brevibacillus agri TaxID=51101 RepID=UPI0002A4FE2E|nr:hypothetical protein [Brevibacillus agri]ELK39012.1 hypothetical protein D478_26309 [Brevibacillus agri BAB-2500]MDR9504790.1 hypothetical protein [Brevibacillus agri]